MEILTASHLSKQYGQGPNLVKALDDVSISIHQGEFVAIIGTSGSGKSTLLNMLGGLDRPTSGSVKVDRFELGKLKDEDLTVFRRQRIGFIFRIIIWSRFSVPMKTLFCPCSWTGNVPTKGSWKKSSPCLAWRKN